MRIHFRGEELWQLSRSFRPQAGAGGEEEPRAGQAAELVIQLVGRRREAGRGSHVRLCPRHHAPQWQLCPSSSSSFLLSAPVQQSQGAWLLATTLPFLQTNNKVPVKQTCGLTRVAHVPTGCKMRAHRFNLGSFNAIQAHLMSCCEVFNTCKSLSWGPARWHYPHSSQNGTGIICQKTGLSHSIQRRVRLPYSQTNVTTI